MKKCFLGLALLCLSSIAFSQISTFPWVEDFETVGLPAGWTQQYQTASVDWITYNGGIYGSPTAAYSGSKNAFFSADNYDDNQTMLISPALDITSLTNPVLSFYHVQVPFDTDQDELYVYYKTSAAGPWILLASYTSAVMAWTGYELQIPVSSSELYIGFSAKSGYGDGVSIDLVTVQDQIACDVPTGVLVQQTWETGATISWTEEASSSDWQIEFGLSAFTQGGGTVVNSANNVYTLTELLSNQEYDFYLRSYCDPTFSDWIGPFTFTTDCSPQTHFPYYESFESTNAPANCWTISYANASPNPQNLVTHSTQYAHTGSRSVKFSSLYVGAPYNQYLITREMDFSQGMQLSFRYRKAITGSETFCVGTSTTNNNTTSFTWSDNITDASTAWQYFTQNIPSNVKYIAIQYKSNFQNSLFIDELIISEGTDCYVPIDITVNNVGSQQAELEWLAQNGETEWIIEYGPDGFALGTGTVLNVTENPFTITGLNPETAYDIYLSADCGASTSEESAVINITTLPLCIPLSALNVLNTTYNSVNLGWTQNGAVFYEIEYGLGGFMQGSGSFASSLTGSSTNITGLLANTEYDFYIRAYCGSSSGFSDWYGPITQRTHLCSEGCYYTVTLSDYEGNGWEDVSLDVYQDGIFTGNLTLANGSLQEYQVFLCDGNEIEIVLNQDSFSDECAYSIYSPYDVYVTSKEFGDLGFYPDQAVVETFIASCTEPACYPPISPGFSQLTNTSCVISWTAAPGVTTYRIEYGLEGFIIGTGTFINDISALSYEISGLSQLTAYDVYVYSDCDANGYSQEVGPISFTTLSNPVALDFCGLNIPIADNAYTQVNFTVSGYSAGSAYTHIYPESVSFIIEHPFISDIDMFLESPEGVIVSLVEDAGGAGDNFGDVSGSCSFKTIVSLNPTHGPISAGTAPFNGNYSPKGNLNDFNTGSDINGIWKLRIADDNTFFTGQLIYFNISFNETRTLITDGNTFTESISNDGSISNSINLELFNETFATTGLLTENTDFTVENLPAGLVVSINATAPNTAVLSLTGNAVSHVYDIDNLVIYFEDLCFSTTSAVPVNGNEQVFNIDFFHTDNLSNDAVWETILCFDPLSPAFVSYKITNDGQADLAAGTQFDLIVEYPVGTYAFTESLELEEALPIGESISGSCTNPLYFAATGSYAVKSIIDFDDDSFAGDNEITSLISSVTHEIGFPLAINDTIFVTGFPLTVTTSATFIPSSFEQTLFYFWNGIEGGSTFEATEEGWIYLNTESSYCNIADSVYIALNTSLDFVNLNILDIYPNPADERLNLSSDSEIYGYKIVSVDGRLIDENSNPLNSHFVEISISYLKSGMYIIIIDTDKGQIKRNFIRL
jgi:subtilisin-like proprotein convertase family protein